MALFARANANAALLTNNCYLLKLTSHDVIFRGFASYTSKFSTARRASMCTCLVHSFSRCNVPSESPKNFIQKSHVEPHNANYKPYWELLAQRRQEANRSIIVQVQSSNSYEDLFTYCKQFGAVNEMHHYTVKENAHFYLIEFNEVASAMAALEAATHINVDEVIPVQSPMLWFRNTLSSTHIKARNNANLENPSSQPVTINGSRIPTDDEVIEKLMAAESMSEQMTLLHDVCKLDEVGIRLRFLTAYQLEQSFVGLFPQIAVFPFGSSVNGFGKRGCDLDLVLTLEHNMIKKPSSRFIFHTKSTPTDSKARSRRLMEMIADTMQYSVPGVTNVRRILQARVPIIKYDHNFTGLECDLSMTNTSAVYMSELLCLYGEVDWRVRPLVFTIRHWAKSVGLTNASPGRSITNFSITLLVLFYLQRMRILPSLNTLKDLAGKADIRLTDHSVDCTFLRDVTKIPITKGSANTDNLETLLYGFFRFYSTFDFPGKAISIREGATIFKPDFSPLYICNPLETNLNVSQNVSTEGTQKLKLAMRDASFVLEVDDNLRHGIRAIFGKNLGVVTYVAGQRVVSVKGLFDMPNEAKDKPPKPVKSAVQRISEDSDESEANRNFRMKKWRARR